MSLKRNAFHSVAIANNLLGGAKATKSARTRAGRLFTNFALANGWPISDLRNATFEMVKAWVEHLRACGIKLANLNNKVSCLRALLAARGVDLVATRIADSKALDLESRDRSGTKLPATDEIFETAIQKALEIGEVGFAHALRLERYLGIRGLEALMSTHQLKIYARDALKMHEDSIAEVHIKDGTKGARPRFVKPIRAYSTITLETILAAAKFSDSNNNVLVKGTSEPTLKSARKRYHRLAKKVGLTGQYAPHSLRYRYATDKLVELYSDGVPLREALSVVSNSLGHGISRKTFVRKVYASTIIGSMPPTTLKEDIAALIVELEAMMAKTTQNSNDA